MIIGHIKLEILKRAAMVTKIKFLCIVAMLLFTLGLPSCCRHEMPPMCREFYDLPAPQQEKQFPTYPLEKQLDIYRCEMRRKPPVLGRAYDIASGGEKNIPVLLEQLRAEKDEIIQGDFIYIFQIMSREGYLRDKQEVVEQIKRVVSQMTYYRDKEQAQEALDEIEKNVRSEK